MAMLYSKKTCSDCGPLPKNHFSKYFESVIEHAFPRISVKLSMSFNTLVEKFLLMSGLLRKFPYEPLSEISTRSSIFIEEAIRRGIKIFTLFGPLGPVGRFYMEKDGKVYGFEGLPAVEFLRDCRSEIIDDKAKVKEVLKKLNLPTPNGRLFSIFQFRRAVIYGLSLGFPLVVKPRSGSISHHVFVDIRTEEKLRKALKSAFSYEPYVIVERYLEGVKTYRATVVDFSNIACVLRMPAHIVGDGSRTIRELIDIKNSGLRRGKPGQKDTTLYKIVIDGTTEHLLSDGGRSLSSIPQSGEFVYLQEKVILDLGADLFEVSGEMHSDNKELMSEVSRVFNARLVGIDFLAEDISKSWKEQKSAIVELNSLPYIDMHHFPTEGEPVNVAGFLCDMVERHY